MKRRTISFVLVLLLVLAVMPVAFGDYGAVQICLERV